MNFLALTPVDYSSIYYEEDAHPLAPWQHQGETSTHAPADFYQSRSTAELLCAADSSDFLMLTPEGVEEDDGEPMSLMGESTHEPKQMLTDGGLVQEPGSL